MAIQQHPLPQDISNYRFRLIGDMTIKQFGSLAIFIVLGILAYSLPLPFFFKYPLAIIFVSLGIGIAFVPVQGRPMEQWILAFIKSIYSPTQYVWKQNNLSEADRKSLLEKTQNTPIQHQIQPTSTPATTPVSAPVAAPASTPIVSPVTETPVSETPNVESPSPEPQVKQPILPASAPEPTLEKHVSETQVQPAPQPNLSQVAAPTTNLPIPFTPTTPNTLVGLTLTPDGKILDGVMVEIRSQGQTIRATKSNKLGQFLFARPLENGLFQILAEKDSFKFATYSLELKGEIIKPLKIQAES